MGGKQTVMNMKKGVMLVLLVGMLNAGVLNWMGTVDTKNDVEHHKKTDDKHHIRDTEHKKKNR